MAIRKRPKLVKQKRVSGIIARFKRKFANSTVEQLTYKKQLAKVRQQLKEAKKAS